MSDDADVMVPRSVDPPSLELLALLERWAGQVETVVQCQRELLDTVAKLERRVAALETTTRELHQRTLGLVCYR